ncbi:MAG: hypothetical protein RLZZ427_408 [Pseudomonadota bacterium]|jgi:hypothetical protein
MQRFAKTKACGLMPATLLLVVLAIDLSACKGGEKQQGAGNAQGQILPGSASDAMIPLDTVRSQAPLAPRTSANADSAADAEATDAAAVAEPTASKPAEKPAEKSAGQP